MENTITNEQLAAIGDKLREDILNSLTKVPAENVTVTEQPIKIIPKYISVRKNNPELKPIKLWEKARK